MSNIREKRNNYVDGSVSSEELLVVSFVGSVSDMSSIFCSRLVEFGGSSVDSGFVGGGGGVGDLVTGEFRCCCCCCCSNSYSLIKRFFSGWALFDEIDVVGDADDDIGDADIGGLFKFDGWSVFIDNGGSCWVSDEDESV